MNCYCEMIAHLTHCTDVLCSMIEDLNEEIRELPDCAAMVQLKEFSAFTETAKETIRDLIHSAADDVIAIFGECGDKLCCEVADDFEAGIPSGTDLQEFLDAAAELHEKHEPIGHGGE